MLDYSKKNIYSQFLMLFQLNDMDLRIIPIYHKDFLPSIGLCGYWGPFHSYFSQPSRHSFADGVRSRILQHYIKHREQPIWKFAISADNRYIAICRQRDIFISADMPIYWHFADISTFYQYIGLLPIYRHTGKYRYICRYTILYRLIGR